LTGSDGPLGVLFLTSREPGAGFDEEHLQVTTAMGRIAGLALDDARAVDQLRAENRLLRDEIAIEHDMVGDSQPMQHVYQFIERVAPVDTTVLITGESGTGKELVARAIHRNSLRSDRPFVAINAAALTASLLESELFGHERGAFTGAINQKRGKFEIAHGGTIFLDEIGELSLDLQVKLLRVLQEREFERVGGTQSITVDVRVIAATNRNLRELVGNRKFREDLYYRLDVVSVRIPPLRERREDIPLLANYFVSKFTASMGKGIKGISREARRKLSSHDWPGNVRELENAIERAVVLGSSDTVLAEDLPEPILEQDQAGDLAAEGFHNAVKEAKREIIVRAVVEAGGNQTKAAAALGIHHTYLSRLIRILGLRERISHLEL
jgi:Nif-specific regulatory protein